MPKRRPQLAESADAKSQAENSATRPREARGARRKRETRERLLRAAFELMAERGADAVAINEITEAADVGFGSFYNHFESKEAIHAAVLRMVFDGFGAALDRLTATVDDPAEKIAICVRHTITAAARDPLWGQLLLREWYRPQAFSSGLGHRLLRDISAGVAAERFEVKDPLMALVVAGGTVVGVVGLQVALPDGGSRLMDEAGLSGLELDERAAVTLLRALGLKEAEARTIVGRALPALGWEPSFAENTPSVSGGRSLRPVAE